MRPGLDRRCPRFDRRDRLRANKVTYNIVTGRTTLDAMTEILGQPDHVLHHTKEEEK